LVQRTNTAGRLAENHLTKRAIDAARYTGTNNTRCVLWDDDPRGLGLRVFPSGKRTFVLSYRTAVGRKRLMTLGDYGVLTLDAARMRARAELSGVESKAADPLADKQRRLLEAQTGTVETMVRTYVETRRNDPRNPMRSADEGVRLAENCIFPTFGSRSWSDVKRSEVRAWHGAMKATPYQANRVLQLLKAAYSWRIAQDDEKPEHRTDARNPCWGVKLFREQPRQVRLELADLTKLDAAIDAETSDPYLRAYFRFLIATGCRRGEALAIEWADVSLDTDHPTATFRTTKNGTPHTVALSKQAVQLLRDLPQVEGNPYVFIGHCHGTHLRSPNKAWERVRERAGLGQLRIHDLRRSFGSWLGDAGFSSKQIGAALGHRSDITSRVYMAIGDQSKRAAVDAVQALMKNARKPKGKRKAAVLMFPNRQHA
jgi:integrase